MDLCFPEDFDTLDKDLIGLTKQLLTYPETSSNASSTNIFKSPSFPVNGSVRARRVQS